MSWSGFKKAVNRGGTTLMQKVGQVETTDDSVFKSEEARYRTLEKNGNALQKEAKNYLDSIRSLSASSARIANTIDLFFGTEAGEQAMAANAYKRAVEGMEQSVAQNIDAPYRATVLEPIGKLCSYWPEINNALSKRHKKLLDYDAARSKARKLSDKPSDDATKLPRAEQESEAAKEVFEAMDSQLRNDLPQILDLRIPYLDPSFECMVRMQTHFAADGYDKLGSVQRYFAEGIREDYAAGNLDAQVEGCLQELQRAKEIGRPPPFTRPSAPTPLCFTLPPPSPVPYATTGWLGTWIFGGNVSTLSAPFFSFSHLRPPTLLSTALHDARLTSLGRCANQWTVILSASSPRPPPAFLRPSIRFSSSASAHAPIRSSPIASTSHISPPPAPKSRSKPVRAPRPEASLPSIQSSLAESSASEEESLPPAIARARENIKHWSIPIVKAKGFSKRNGVLLRSGALFWEEARKTRLDDPNSHEERARAEKEASSRQSLARLAKRKNDTPDSVARLPETEKELFDLFVRISRLPNRPSPLYFASTHAHYAFRHLVSVVTYRLVLEYCYASSDLATARDVLSEMKDRNIRWDEALGRLILRSHLKRGDSIATAQHLAVMKNQGWNVLPCLNWRRDLGEEGRGLGDRYKPIRKMVPEKGIDRDASKPRGFVGERVQTAIDSNRLISSLDAKLKRRGTYIPPDFTSLTKHDITALVESLVQDFHHKDAFQVSEGWLKANRPVYQAVIRPPPFYTLPLVASKSIPIPDWIRFNNTAIVLANILLRSLIIQGGTGIACQRFLVDFVTRHSPSPSVPIKPTETTLRVLLQGRSNSFDNAYSEVVWFLETFGIPSSPSITPRESPPSWENPIISPKTVAESVSPDTAILMLRIALRSIKRLNRLAKPLESKKAASILRAQTWANCLDTTGAAWQTFRVRIMVLEEAKREGLLATKQPPRLRLIAGSGGGKGRWEGK